MRCHFSTPQQIRSRRGSVLLIVLVVIVLLSFGAYTYCELMLAELEATTLYGRRVETQVMADSAIELALAQVAHRSALTPVNLYHNPQLFHGIMLHPGDSPRGRGRFSLVAPVESDSTGTMVRFGLMDESAKINVNNAAALKPEDAANILMYLPNMTVELSDAILDFVDADDTPRQNGAESDYYQSMTPPYVAKNSPLESLDELLLVRGMSPQLLYGEDLNHNGLLDPNENDADRSPPFDNADGILQLGLSSYLSIYSKEMNRRRDSAVTNSSGGTSGAARIDLNSNMLSDLYDQLAEEFNEDVATFVVAYRINGASGGSGQQGGGAGGQSNNSGSGNSGGGNSGGGSGGGSSGRGSSGSGGSNSGGSGKSGGGGSSGGGSSGSGSSQSNQQAVAQALTQAIQGMMNLGQGGQVTRGGMDLTKGGQSKINSIYDLIGTDVRATVNGAGKTLTSPWSADPSDMRQYLPELLDKLTTVAGEEIPGRININETRPEVLLGLPGMTPEVVDAIMASKMVGANGEPLANTISSHQTPAWLVMEGIVDLPTMSQLDKWLTTRGDVYRAQGLGYFEDGGQMTRIEAVIDATQTPPRVIYQRDLTPLGRGYTIQQLQLSQFATPAATPAATPSR